MVIRYDDMVGQTGSTNVTKSTDLADLFNDFMAQAKGILGTDWEGQASAAFEQAHAEWNQKLLSYSDTHNQVGQTVMRTAEEAFAKDQQARGFFV
ncbi:MULTISPECIES: WXG100 family type VII secretion target [Amycolatopsis]|uniref:WXG100 family type VII secretion target n=1 Tax=Amycolatopsis thermoflava TaxID=84480 RepID=A0A3N2GRZ6_9PSEU|nr:WXG100 family type VII secretion target [Amycolatopsis thermoflava]ROS39009.1 WXG100 family type VII secretion target [Amycolatopsis thermoflava]